ncbi:MAG: hypothetical protein IT370_15655 [Deltaproteobacteria bacterium]|nr:hypothetical protein [Deltaproteobacteria bacterium]
MIPLALAICENGLRRDLTFLKAFAGATVDLRVTPVEGGQLDGSIARLLKRQAADVAKAGLEVHAILIHHDADTSSHAGRLQMVMRWFERNGLGETGAGLIVCAPKPCIERWLCLGEGLATKAKGASPAAGCAPWKKAWEGKRGNDLDRVRAVAREARDTLTREDDFASFFAQWKKLLEP